MAFIRDRKKLLASIVVAWTAIIIFTIGFTQIFQAPSTQVSDYATTFYVAGSMVVDGNTDKLYPPPDSGFKGAPFQACAHQILPYMPEDFTSMYMYMPIIAWLFVPFSLVAPHTSLLAWQILTLTTLVICAFLITAGVSKQLGENAFAKLETTLPEPNPGPLASRRLLKKHFFLCCLSVSFLPVVVTLWQGQVGIVFGVLPISLAYYLLSSKHAFLAGLCWSFAIFKPQFLFPATLVVASQFFNKKWQLAAGICTGLALIVLLNVVVCGPDMTLDWLRILRLSDHIFSDPQWAQPRLMASLPRVLTYLAPSEIRDWLKPLIYSLSIAFLGLGLWQIRIMAKSSLSQAVQLNLALILGLFVTPFLVPHLFVYDLSLFVLAAYIYFSFPFPAAITARFRSFFLLAWVLINGYTMFALRFRNVSYSFVLVIFLIEIYRQLILIVKDYPEESTEA